VIKRLALLRRRDGFGKAAFDRYWRGPHGDLARTLPGLVGYLQNSVTSWPSAPAATTPGFSIDGLAELWFDSAESMARAFDSDAGQALPADEKAFLDGITILAVTETILREGRGATKAFLLLGGENAPALRTAIRDNCEKSGLPEIAACIENRIEAVITSPDLWTEPAPPIAAFELRFEKLTDVERAFRSAEWSRLRARAGPGCKVFVALVDEVVIVARGSVGSAIN
jgi:uncharacterized protein (TIGR02118 family)